MNRGQMITYTQIKEARDLYEHVIEGPMANQPTVYRMAVLLNDLANEVELLRMRIPPR